MRRRSFIKSLMVAGAAFMLPLQLTEFGGALTIPEVTPIVALGPMVKIPLATIDSSIRWMQKEQGLWELGDAETVIVDYLEKNYGVADVPWRRKPLSFERELGSE